MIDFENIMKHERQVWRAKQEKQAGIIKDLEESIKLKNEELKDSKQKIEILKNKVSNLQDLFLEPETDVTCFNNTEQ